MLIISHDIYVAFYKFFGRFLNLFMLGSVSKGIKAVPENPTDSDSTGAVVVDEG